MTHLSVYKIIFIFLTLLSASVPIHVFAFLAPDNAEATENRQIQFASISVNGRIVTGPNSSAHRRDGRILIPVAAVARSLGDVLNAHAASRSLSVKRQTGTSAEFDARSGQVEENGATILTVSNAAEITFSPNVHEILLPIEITAALFDVSVRYDSDKKTVLITRGAINNGAVQIKTSRGVAEIHQIDYEYNLNRYSSSTNHNLVILAAGRIAGGRFSFNSNSSKSSSRAVSMQNATFDFERPNGERYVAGDFGSGANLQFLSSNIRGFSASVPVGDTFITAFAGRSFSGVIFPETEPFARFQRSRYDTTTVGIFATAKSSSRVAPGSPFTFSGGAMRFGSKSRSGNLVTGSVNYDASRFRMQGDFGYGKFRSTELQRARKDGYGGAADLTATLQISDDLAIQARYTKIGENFLSPQSGVREPLDLKAAGISWSPLKWLSASLNASTSHRPGDTKQNNRFVTAAFAVTPGAGAPRFYFSHMQSSTSQIRSAAFTVLNASKDFSRLRLYVNATRIKNFGPASASTQFGASYAVNDTNSIEITQGIGTGSSLNGQFDWRTSNVLKKKLSLSAGFGYNYTPTSKFAPYERLSASVNLPRETSLLVNFYNTNQGPTILVSLRGSLFKKRGARAFLDSSAFEMNSYGKVSGRVYQDVDQNGKYDVGVDKPQADVKVRVDGNRYVVSNESGIYQFESVAAGEHKVYIDLLSVRADLTLLGSAVQSTNLMPGHTLNFDFRLVRTGRISGRVWLDANGNGHFDDGEAALADVRVVTGSGRDTLTDADGNFTIGDLAPGEHLLLLDEKTIPEKTMSGSKPIAVQAFAGRETNGINLTVIMTPAEIRRFPSKQD